MNELHIRLRDIVSNFQYFQKMARASAVLKADAYGVGMERIAKALHKAGGREFYTFTLDEALLLRKNLGNNATIYFFASIRNQQEANISAKHKLIPVLNQLSELSLWQKVNWQDEIKPLCVHVDTGMNRLGLSKGEWHEFCKFYNQHKKDFGTPLLLSHLACADEKEHKQNKKQLESAKLLLRDVPEATLSLSASNGALLGKAYHFQQLRIGVGLYGVKPLHSRAKLKQALGWQSEILQVRSLRAGEVIGYGASSVGKSRKVAIMACGYADGLRRNFAKNGKVYYKGRACSMLGRISMDCSAVDVSDVSAKVGDTIEIIGKNQTLQAVADSMETIAYEVLCGIGQRVKRKFIE